MTDKPLTDLTFSSFELHPRLQAGLEAAGFTRLTPIQALTLPVALPGGDVAGQAQTGTGKTLAFLVAVVNRLLTRPALAERKPEDPRALILAPTRELAIQIHKDAMKFGPELGLKFALVYGGVDYDKQRALLQEGVDVIIATPGRLIDYVKQHKVVSLHACEVCVLDEADRMFDLGFIKDIRFLLRRMPIRTERQTLLFSATFNQDVLNLASMWTRNAEFVEIEPEQKTAERVEQTVYLVSDDDKLPVLVNYLKRPEVDKAIVFANRRDQCRDLEEDLRNQGVKVSLMSGEIAQNKRLKTLDQFKKGQIQVLVATDVAGRGIHVNGVTHVFNYNLPENAEDYVHRIGRTGRAGSTGVSVSFAGEEDAFALPEIEKYISQKLKTAVPDEDLMAAMENPPITRKRGGRRPQGNRGSGGRGGPRPRRN